MIVTLTAVRERHRPRFLYCRRVLPGRNDQVPVARRFVKAVLAENPRVEDAEIVMAELVSNAIKFSASGREHGWLIAEVRCDNLLLTSIAVHDLGGGGTPQFARENADDLADCGRGLAMVSALAHRAGYRHSSIGGYQVWAQLPWHAQQAGSLR